MALSQNWKCPPNGEIRFQGGKVRLSLKKHWKYFYLTALIKVLERLKSVKSQFYHVVISNGSNFWVLELNANRQIQLCSTLLWYCVSSL